MKLSILKTSVVVVVIMMNISAVVCAQSLKQMNPLMGALIDKSPEQERIFKAEMTKCYALWSKAETDLTQTEREQLANCNEKYDGVGNYYDIFGGGCSWYCGGGLDTQTASSELVPQGKNTYSASNAHDLNYGTAWVEGVPGPGIGESLVYDFPPENPRVTKIIVVNGYAKSPKAWNDNGRVKKLKLYIDNKPVAILNLKDTRQEQIFTFSPIGVSDRKDYEKLKRLPHWTMKFEIMEVYKGDKYDDTAITEIYFDGIDVH